MAGTFLRPSAGLVMPSVPANAAASMEELARAIPRDALILIPDEDAGFHVQTALEFASGRDVLLLPLAGEWARRLEDVMACFLTRQIDRGRRVVLLRAGSKGVDGPLVRHFRSTSLFEAPLAYERLPFVRGDAFPGPPKTGEVLVRVVELHPVSDAQAPTSIGESVAAERR